jgi:glutamine synthetase
MAATADDVRRLARELDVQTVRLQFTDILGIVKNVDLPLRQLDKALAGEIIIDGSAIEGFVRLRESDMYLRPDPATFAPLPWTAGTGVTARLICDLHNLDGSPFQGDPRRALKRVVEQASALGYSPQVGPESEFFLFRRDERGKATTETYDQASYYDLAPVDEGEAARAEMVRTLGEMGFEIEQSHHEISPGQHEIDWQYRPAVEAADAIVTFRFVVRALAARRGLHATFMPKPLNGVNGSGLHLHQSLFRTGQGGLVNAFYAERDPDRLSNEARRYLAGLLAHARAFTAITNPLVNSYKRLVPGYDAPIYVAWTRHDPSTMARIPARRGVGTRIEVRSPDPACNPYLALAVMLAAGLDGLRQRLDLPPEVDGNPDAMTPDERAERGIVALPANLHEALGALREDDVVQAALGEDIFLRFVEAKEVEWEVYRSQVHRWEVDQYLATF